MLSGMGFLFGDFLGFVFPYVVICTCVIGGVAGKHK